MQQSTLVRPTKPTYSAPAVAQARNASAAVPSQRPISPNLDTPVYISDLSGYKIVIARQLAALSLHALLGDKFSLNELMRLAKAPKPTMWSKLVEAMRPPSKKKPVKGMSFLSCTRCLYWGNTKR